MKRRANSRQAESRHPAAHAAPARPALLIACLALCAALFLQGCKRDDMANQPREKPLGHSPYFPDGAESRTPPEHTLPITAQVDDDPNDPSWEHPTTLTHFPFPITRADLYRGQQEFDVYCTPCHGLLGDGNGMVPQRGFVHPPSYHTDRLRSATPAYFYDVMTKGIGAMFPYADRVSPDDRWRIAAYIRALQLAEYAPRPPAPTGAPR